MDERDIDNIRVEVAGNEPPFKLTLEVVGFVREGIDADKVVPVVHDYGREMAPDIAAALERVVLRRLRNAVEDFEL